MLFLRLVLLVSVACVSGKTVQVYSNGESSDGVDITVPPDVDNLARFLGEVKPARLFGTQGVIPDRVYNSMGRIVTTWSDIEDGERLYVVAATLRFIWPFVELGHTVTLEPSYFSDAWRPSGPIRLTSVSDIPRVFNLTGFFDDTDADTLIANVEAIQDPLQKLQRSGVGPEITKDEKKKVTSEVRTSSNAFDSTSPTAQKLNHRAFELTRVPYDTLFVDGLQVLRYNQREAYIPHTDWFPVGSGQIKHNFEPHNGGTNRFATIFLYLSDVEQGGQTVFPHAPPRKEQDLTIPKELDELFTAGQWEHQMVQQCYRISALLTPL